MSFFYQGFQYNIMYCHCQKPPTFSIDNFEIMTLSSPISKVIAVYCSNSDVLTLSAHFEPCLQCCHWPQNNAMDPQVRFRPSKSDNALPSILAAWS